MKFLVCAKAATDVVNIVLYMFKLIMNKRWIYSACNNVLSPRFKVERKGAENIGTETISTGSELQHHTARE